MNYEEYIFSGKEKILLVLEWIGISAVLAYFFYRSYIAFGCIMLLVPFFMKVKRKEFMEKRKSELSLQFSDAISFVSANLQAGSSVENAFAGILPDMVGLYGANGYITEEVRILIRGMNNNLNLESLLRDFADRSGVADIKDFADVFSIGKRTGGSIREIILNCSGGISEKKELTEELKTLVSATAFEHKIMCVAPLAIMAYIGFTSKGYFDSLYHNLTGCLFMTLCLAIYVTAFFWGKKIADVKCI